MDWRNIWKMEAENNYAAGIIHRRNGYYEEARRYGQLAVELYRKVNVQTLEDAAPTRMKVRGVYLADIMHEDVVRDRLGLDGLLTERPLGR